MIVSKERTTTISQEDDAHKISLKTMEELKMARKRISWPGFILILAILLLIWLLHSIPVVILSLTQLKVSNYTLTILYYTGL